MGDVMGDVMGDAMRFPDNEGGLSQGSVRVLADGRVWLHMRDMGGHHVCAFWSRDADRRLVLNKCV
jgi:hypothetical protein